ncbi:uncharacterized protein KNAG_0K01920 [Huiozyma naganishii CBS 8797]|uniref:Uncharacterized protein n=1 Tax=Huiozyma naganishii (strain ATCC MYA-139 / BCRC 22969 / CBS 8797 / KCTC 17520 / NBRC 10181 / NCYC 3082 / Yp74L-3) TaxID=1071383 RepID=J7SAX9_HUIN7|nr:hypothetical protein KNAG_0K01920 [Kazachstania naganishii CBS 8797]CCK72556.1 hypothetical protein KNAG_0K01920 [Kazachstania naganishii CBS 8797]
MPIEELVRQAVLSRRISLEDLERLDRGNELLELSDSIAFDLGLHIRRAAQEQYRGRPVAIDISLTSGQQLFRGNSGDGCVADNDEWIRRKRNTVRRFGHSSLYIGIKKGQLDMREKFFADPLEYAFHGGAVPLYIAGCTFPIATVTCSGLKQEEDHLLAAECIRDFAKSM